MHRSIGQTGLVLGVGWGFISRHVHAFARLQVSAVQRLRFVQSWLTQNYFFTFWPLRPREVGPRPYRSNRHCIC